MTDDSTRPDGERLLEHAAYLRRLARALLVDPGRGDDAVQQAWLTALRRPPTEVRSPRSWLGGIVRHLARRQHRDDERRERREHAAATPDWSESAADAASRIEILRRVLDAVESLESPYREILLLRYFDDVSVRDIASRRGVPEPTVRTWIRRGLERLRARLDDGRRESRRAFVLALAPTAGLGSAGVATAAAAGILGVNVGAWMMNGKALVSLAVVVVVSGVALREWSHEPTSIEPAPRAAAEVPPPGATNEPPRFALGEAEPEATRVEVAAASSAAQGWAIRGRTVAADRAPAPDVPLRLRLFNGLVTIGRPGALERARRTIALESDDEGRFSWTVAPPEGPVTIEVAATGAYYSEVAQTYVMEGAPSPDDIELVVRLRDGHLEGVVRDEDGLAVSGAVVRSHGAEETAGDDGRFAMDVPTGVGTAQVVVSADGFATRGVTFLFPERGEIVPVEVTLVRELRATGVVRGEDGLPIEGASVRSYLNESRAATTDASGRFDLGGLDPNLAVHFLDVDAKGYVSNAESFRPESGRIECDITLERGRTLAVQVLGPGGRPVHGARVYVNEVDGHDGFWAATDTRGRFELVVSRGALRILTRHEKFAPDFRTIDGDTDGAGPMEIVLGVPHFVGGRVVDDRGIPIEGASLRVDYRGRRVGDATSDADGRVRVDGLPASELAVKVEAPGHTTVRVPLVPVDVLHHVWTLRRSGGLAGVVLDGRTGRPIPSFRLRLVTPTLHEGERRSNFVSDVWLREGVQFHSEDGTWDTGVSRFEVGAVTAIQAVAPGYAPATVDRVVVTADPRSHVITHRLFSPVVLMGQVVRSETGAPVAGARVRRDEGETAYRLYRSPDGNPGVTTGEDGRFILPVPAGEITLRIEVHGEPAHLEGPFVVSRDAGGGERRIEVGRRGRIEGVLRDGLGRPKGGESIEVSGMHAGELWRDSTETDAGGRFVIEDVPSGDRYVAHVVHRDGEETAAIMRRATVVDGETTHVTLAPSGNAVVTGTVTCDRPLPELVRVMARPLERELEDGSFDGGSSAFVVDGRFRIDGLRAGHYEVGITVDIDGGVFVGKVTTTLVADGVVEVEIVLDRWGS